MGFGQRWRGWIKECVCMASMSLLINVSPSKSFKMERGLRQGDPLSPFLFVLVVEVLHRMVGEAVRHGRISPLLVGKDNIELSHFLIPVNCEREWSERMCSMLGCKEATLPVKYLGISLEANPKLVKTWKPIIDKVEEKLNLWKAKTINKADKLRRFLQSNEDIRDGVPLVRWDIVQAPKRFGGLGVGDAVLRNIALLFKWWWRFSKEDYSLWKKIMCSCNDLNPNVLLSCQPVPNTKGLWSDICQLQIREQQARDKMVRGLSLKLGDDRRIRFWEDNWLTMWCVAGCISKAFLGFKSSRICNRGLWVLGWAGVDMELSLEKDTIPMS
ncbi:uncharacterized protein [Arachis hypogaea]|uniref:uncharacterized protein n=1 Tax=Arachis hypogaea TaxID=3818 RepID=UPI003B20C56E